MNAKRTIEIFSAGCPACEETIELVNQVACPSCEVTVLDMKQLDVASREGRHRSVRRASSREVADCWPGGS